MFIYPISLTIAALAALLNGWLMFRVGQVRGQEKVMIGDGGNDRVIRRMRAHSNFIESAPFVLILLFLLESAMGSTDWLWIIGIIYLLARIAHAIGMDGANKARIAGALLTLLTLVILAVAALYAAFATPQETSATDIVEVSRHIFSA